MSDSYIILDSAEILKSRGSMCTCQIGTIFHTIQSHGRTSVRLQNQDFDERTLKRMAELQLGPPNPRTIKNGNKKQRMA